MKRKEKRREGRPEGRKDGWKKQTGECEERTVEICRNIYIYIYYL